MTLADVGAVSPETLTPWKEDLLWRLYVDTYNRLTLGYADDLLEQDHPALGVLIAGRPEDISEEELNISSPDSRAATSRASVSAPSTGTSAWLAGSVPTKCTPFSRTTGTSGS